MSIGECRRACFRLRQLQLRPTLGGLPLVKRSTREQLPPTRTTTTMTTNPQHHPSSPPPKYAHTRRESFHPVHELLYWPDFPGRGEFIRLAFEAKGIPYTDVTNTEVGGYDKLLAHIDPKATHAPVPSGPSDPIAFAPPIVRVPTENLTISQTPAILAYLGAHHHFAGDGSEAQKYHVHSLALTALDLNDEAHDSHHPISVNFYYEEQKQEALRRSKDFREKRIPKFFSFFDRVLQGNFDKGKGKYLVGNKLSYADTTLWQVLDGLKYAFPKEMAAREKEFELLFGTFYNSVKEEKGVKLYLESERRLPYGNGVYRHYPELDRQE
ncbi:uncharacterized protein EI97DRAFT_464362 [Westerdykella ornata]|uniref:Glutathione S-transferase n=1 Tax=Westerdykella ornata TaxID=318751 RepID=A0A6A6JVI3_WESOR|nr:uncharacterized protein EI97DRAFT_464362 [Westerdykella ornata]KAF2280397.1 hypothetical protein EI97DRAFT_464362 [Westerdykella ornata]